MEYITYHAVRILSLFAVSILASVLFADLLKKLFDQRRLHPVGYIVAFVFGFTIVIQWLDIMRHISFQAIVVTPIVIALLVLIIHRQDLIKTIKKKIPDNSEEGLILKRYKKGLLRFFDEYDDLYWRKYDYFMQCSGLRQGFYRWQTELEIIRLVKFGLDKSVHLSDEMFVALASLINDTRISFESPICTDPKWADENFDEVTHFAANILAKCMLASWAFSEICGKLSDSFKDYLRRFLPSKYPEFKETAILVLSRVYVAGCGDREPRKFSDLTSTELDALRKRIKEDEYKKWSIASDGPSSITFMYLWKPLLWEIQQEMNLRGSDHEYISWLKK